MVFKKQFNQNGKYIDENGARFDVLSCERTESKEWYETGAYREMPGLNGETIRVPVLASRIAVNQGWDTFGSLAEALQAYGAAYEPRH